MNIPELKWGYSLQKESPLGNLPYGILLRELSIGIPF